MNQTLSLNNDRPFSELQFQHLDPSTYSLPSVIQTDLDRTGSHQLSSTDTSAIKNNSGICDPYKIQTDVFSVLLTRVQFIFNTRLKIAFISSSMRGWRKRETIRLLATVLVSFRSLSLPMIHQPFSYHFPSRYLPSSLLMLCT